MSSSDRWRVGVLGAGRVGAVLGAALAAAGHDVVAASGRSEETRARAAELLPGVPLRSPAQVAAEATLLLLAVPDDALPDLVAALAEEGVVGPDHVVAHPAGRHGLAVLEPLAALGARPVALHPAMTFTGTALDLPRLVGCPVGVTVRDADRDLGDGLVAALGGRPVPLAEEQRELYHAGTVHGSNHLVTLVAEARDLLAAAGVADPGGTLRPLLEAALDNSLRDGDAALTGPVVRGDADTVRAHLDRVAVAAPDAVASYVAMARSTLRRVVADGRLGPAPAAEVAELLDAAGRRTP